VQHALHDRDESQHAHDPQGGWQRQRESEGSEENTDPGDDEPLGTFGDANVRGRTDCLSTSLGVGHDLSGDDGEQSATHHPWQVRAHPIQRKSGENRAIGDTVQRGIQEVSPRSARPSHASHGAVEQITDGEDTDDDQS